MKEKTNSGKLWQKHSKSLTEEQHGQDGGLGNKKAFSTHGDTIFHDWTSPSLRVLPAHRKDLHLCQYQGRNVVKENRCSNLTGWCTHPHICETRSLLLW